MAEDSSFGFSTVSHFNSSISANESDEKIQPNELLFQLMTFNGCILYIYTFFRRHRCLEVLFFVYFYFVLVFSLRHKTLCAFVCACVCVFLCVRFCARVSARITVT